MKNRLIRFFWLLVLLTATVGLAMAQTVSERQTVAVFRLSYYDYSLPNAVLGNIDSQITNVFVNMGRFDVIGFEFRLTESDISAFIEQIRLAREANVVMPEQVLLGRQAFTEADFNRLVGAFLVVVPSVTNYSNTYRSRASTYQADLSTTFSIINVESGAVTANFTVDTTGFDSDADQAALDAVEAIPDALEYQLRSVPEFQIRSGVIEIDGRDVYIELGENMGIRVGDEYELTTTRVTGSGRELIESTGLIIIKNVQADFSIGEILFASGSPQVGDAVTEVPRIGTEISLYGLGVLNLTDPLSSDIVPVFGARAMLTRNFFVWHPFAGLEFPLTGDDRVPMIIYVGADLNVIRLRRLSITPAAGVGVGLPIVPMFQNDFTVSQAGGFAEISISWLFGRSAHLFARAGGAYFVGLDGYGGYGGPFVGAGFGWKF